jgi:2-iminobutanoate/2-iminopropanoate deaminase
MKKIVTYAGVMFFAVCGFAQQRQVVNTKDAPKAIGPYSQAIKAQGFVYASGQIPLDPVTGKIVGSDCATQAERVLKNLQAVLEASGTDLEHVVKTTIYLKNISDFAAVNDVYGRYFKDNPPARSTVQVVSLPKDALVEIDAIAVLPTGH